MNYLIVHTIELIREKRNLSPDKVHKLALDYVRGLSDERVCMMLATSPEIQEHSYPTLLKVMGEIHKHGNQSVLEVVREAIAEVIEEHVNEGSL